MIFCFLSFLTLLSQAIEMDFVDGLLTAMISFGWVNASYVVGLNIIDLHMRRSLGALVPWPNLQRAIHKTIQEEREETESAVVD